MHRVVACVTIVRDKDNPYGQMGMAYMLQGKVQMVLNAEPHHNNAWAFIINQLQSTGAKPNEVAMVVDKLQLTDRRLDEVTADYFKLEGFIQYLAGAIGMDVAPFTPDRMRTQYAKAAEAVLKDAPPDAPKLHVEAAIQAYSGILTMHNHEQLTDGTKGTLILPGSFDPRGIKEA